MYSPLTTILSQNNLLKKTTRNWDNTITNIKHTKQFYRTLDSLNLLARLSTVSHNNERLNAIVFTDADQVNSSKYLVNMPRTHAYGMRDIETKSVCELVFSVD